MIKCAALFFNEVQMRCKFSAIQHLVAIGTCWMVSSQAYVMAVELKETELSNVFGCNLIYVTFVSGENAQQCEKIRLALYCSLFDALFVQ